MGDDALLDDVGDVIHIIDRNVTLVLGIDPVKLFQRIDSDGIAGSIFTRETTVGIFDEDGTLNMLLEDGLVDGFGLRLCGLIKDNYLGIGDSVDAELEEQTLAEGILLIKVPKDGDVDTIEPGQVENLEGSDAMHDAIFCYEEYARNTCCILGFIGGNRHDE